MIFKIRLIKTLITVFATLSLGACSNMPNFISPSPANADAETAQSDDIGHVPTDKESTSNKKNNDKTASTNQAAPQSQPQQPNDVLVQQLVSQSDLYIQSKRSMPSNSTQQALQALSLLQQGQLEQSEAHIEKLLQFELNPTSAALVLAGDVAQANGKLDTAKAYYEKALTVNEYNAKALNRLALYWRERGQFDIAEQHYNRAINAQPADASSYRNRAILLDLYSNQKQAALSDYRHYLALIEYALAQHENGTQLLSDAKLKTNKTNTTLAKRWVLDVSRQIKQAQRLDTKSTAINLNASQQGNTYEGI